MQTPRVVRDGLIVGESARWHDCMLWLSHPGAAEILAIDLDGNAEVMARVPVDIAFCFDWHHDRRLRRAATAVDEAEHTSSRRSTRTSPGASGTRCAPIVIADDG